MYIYIYIYIYVCICMYIYKYIHIQNLHGASNDRPRGCMKLRNNIATKHKVGYNVERRHPLPFCDFSLLLLL